jgi:AraC-like DNA-binding protein
MPDLRATVLAAFEAPPTAELRALLDYGLDESATPPHVSTITRRMGIPLRTLAARLQRGGLPSPNRILHWCVVLRACSLLGAKREPVARVAEELGLAKPFTLRRLLRRYLQCTPGQLRNPERLQEAMLTFTIALSPGISAGRERRT